MGLWNSHTSVGNILGSIIPGIFADSEWGWSFVVPGIIIGSLGIIVFLFLVPRKLCFEFFHCFLDVNVSYIQVIINLNYTCLWHLAWCACMLFVHLSCLDLTNSDTNHIMGDFTLDLSDAGFYFPLV